MYARKMRLTRECFLGVGLDYAELERNTNEILFLSGSIEEGEVEEEGRRDKKSEMVSPRRRVKVGKNVFVLSYRSKEMQEEKEDERWRE